MITCTINNQNIYTQYGAYLGEQSLVNLLTPPPNKPYLENKSANANGKTVYIHSTNAPALQDERNVTLIFHIEGNSQAQMLTRYKAMCALFSAGEITLSTSLEANVVYHLNYLSCKELKTFFNRRATFKVEFNEPNPANRT